MKYATARNLVSWYFPGARLSRSTVAHAMQMLNQERRSPNFFPTPGNFDRTMVLLEIDHPLWPLYRRMQERQAVMQRGLVEATMKGILEDPDVGQRLGRHGLAILRADRSSVELAPTSPRLAQLVNGLRVRTPIRGLKSATLVQIALDLRQRPQRLSAEARLKAAEILDQLNVDAVGLLEMAEYAPLSSPWLFCATVKTPSFGPPF